MKNFEFALDRALNWRRTQLAVAEARLREQLAALAAIDRARTELDAAGRRAEVETRDFQPLGGGDLGALENFSLRLRKHDRDLQAKRVACQKETAACQSALIEARRRCRLLERLKERRWAEWQAARDRELEDLAADSYLAQWARRRASSL